MEEMILVKDKNGIEFYTTESYSIEDIEKTQKKSVEMMSVIVNIFEKHGIDYMIAHGTLLGLIRHTGIFRGTMTATCSSLTGIMRGL